MKIFFLSCIISILFLGYRGNAANTDFLTQVNQHTVLVGSVPYISTSPVLLDHNGNPVCPYHNTTFKALGGISYIQKNTSRVHTNDVGQGFFIPFESEQKVGTPIICPSLRSRVSSYLWNNLALLTSRVFKRSIFHLR